MSEEEYLEYLIMERNLYAWCLVNYGNYEEYQAKEEALKFYPYEGKEKTHRWLIFHDKAWHWAMIKIYGHGYWHDRPKLLKPSPAYEEEVEKY